MREIKFRGKDEKGYWHYGNLCICDNGDYVIGNCPTGGSMFYRSRVIPETVGQYIGLNDRVKNKEIYDMDIVKALNRACDCKDNWRDYFQTFEVTYLNGCWMFGNYNAHEFFNRFIYIEVIGNKFEGVKEE